MLFVSLPASAMPIRGKSQTRGTFGAMLILFRMFQDIMVADAIQKQIWHILKG